MTRRELINRKNVILLQLELMRREEKLLVAQFGKKGYQQRVDAALENLFENNKRINILNKAGKDDEKEL